MTWGDAASIRIKLKVPTTHRHHHERAALALAGSLIHKFDFFMDYLRIPKRKTFQTNVVDSNKTYLIPNTYLP